MYFGRSELIMNRAQSCAIWPIIRPHMGPDDNMVNHGVDFNLFCGRKRVNVLLYSYRFYATIFPYTLHCDPDRNLIYTFIVYIPCFCSLPSGYVPGTWARIRLSWDVRLANCRPRSSRRQTRPAQRNHWCKTPGANCRRWPLANTRRNSALQWSQSCFLCTI